MAKLEIITKPSEYVLTLSQVQLDKLAALTGRVIGGDDTQPIYNLISEHVKVEYQLIDGNYAAEELSVIHFKAKE